MLQFNENIWRMWFDLFVKFKILEEIVIFVQASFLLSIKVKNLHKFISLIQSLKFDLLNNLLNSSNDTDSFVESSYFPSSI